ncbi:hypothetical protein [Kitasatospora sp. NPDC059827]|uniref:hypothetical protein n=1 Tax=Kitasatospora sp. NPDC059827 TaxID=3346964 RepID=UPI0036575602
MEIMLGPERSHGPEGFDLGWLLGELLELHWLAASAGKVPRHAHAEIAHTLTAAHGPVPEVSTVAHAAVLRILTHMHDHAAYVAWNEEFSDYFGLIAELVDHDGLQVLELAGRCAG